MSLFVLQEYNVGQIYKFVIGLFWVFLILGFFFGPFLILDFLLLSKALIINGLSTQNLNP
jgi:hypothetical protein